MTSHSVFGRLKAALAAGTVAAVTLSGLVAAPAFAAPSASTPAIAPAVVEGTPVTDVQFRWGLNNETNNGAFDGSMNLLAAGMIDKTSGGDRISQTEWKAEDGNVSIEKLNSSGGYDLATWAGLTTNAAGASIKPPTNTNYSGHQVVIDGGTGTVDPVAGTASYQWQGTFTVAYYQGLTQFTVKDPALTVDADGTGSVTATLGGWGTSMEDPELFLVLDEVPNVEIATLTDVEVTPGGVIATPDYAGVEVTVPEGAQQQARTTGFGSFPQGFIDFQQKTGQSSYWFTSGGSTDAAKVASALSATHEAVTVEPEPTENPEPTDTPEPTATPEPSETASPEPTDTAEPTETAAPTDSPEPTDTIDVTGAQLEWAYSRYAQYGVFGWWYQAASGAKVSLAEWRDGQTISGNAEDANVAFHGVRFEGGTGTIDAETGAGTITWANTGNWVLNAYRNAGYDIAPDETLANPILTIAADGTGVLSFDATIPEHVDFMYSGQTVPQVGPQRVTLATFSNVSIDDNGTLTLVPDYAGRTAPSTQTDWLDCDGIGGSWPAEWVNFVPSSVKTHYYTTSCSGLNLKKPALPVTVRTEATAPSIVSQPTSSVTAVKAGALLSYQVSANGTGISYQWQRSLDGGQNWTDVEGETGYKYLGRAKVSDDGGSFRVVVSGNGGDSVTSAAVGPITVTTEALGTPNFSNTGTVGLGDAAYVGASVTGAPLPEYEWQKQIDGVWTDVEPNRTVVSGQRVESGFNFTAATWEDAGTYRVTISNGVGDPIVSEPLTLTVVNEAPVITTQPEDAITVTGVPATFTTAVTGKPSVKMQWQYSTDDGENWQNWGEGGTNYSLIVTSNTVTEELDGALFRAKATSLGGEVYTETATLTVEPRIAGKRIYVFPNGPVDPTKANTFRVIGVDLALEGVTSNLRYALTDTTRWQPGQNGTTAGAIAQKTATRGSIVASNGVFTGTLVAPANSLSSEKSFGIATMGVTATERAYDTWTPIALKGAKTEVDNAQLSWAYSGYAQEGVFGPWRMWTEGSGVNLTTIDGQVVSGDATQAGKAYNVVRFNGGTGEIDPETGAGSISWPDSGSWKLNAYPAMYGAPDETLSEPILTINEDGTGALSFSAYLPAHNDVMYGGGQMPAVGPDRKVLATFSTVSITDGVISVTPEFTGREYTAAEGTSPYASCEGVGGSWPAEWIDFLPTSVRAHYYTTSCTGLNLTKPPFAFTVDTNEAEVAITTQPTTSVSTLAASVAFDFGVVATGNPISYQWQRSIDGGEWVDVEGATDSRYTREAVPADDKAKFRVVVSGAGDSVTSSEVGPFTVTTAPMAISMQPWDVTAGLGELVQTGVYASGSPRPTVEWQHSTDDGFTWNTVQPYMNTETGTSLQSILQFEKSELANAGKYRAILRNGTEELVSNTITVSIVNEAPVIRSHPRDRSTLDGLSATFSSSAEQTRPEPNYQWQVSTDDGETWTDWSPEGATTDAEKGISTSLSVVNPGLELNGAQFRQRAYSTGGEAFSTPATLTVLPLTGERRILLVPDEAIDPTTSKSYQVLAEGFEPVEGGAANALRVAFGKQSVWQPGATAPASGFGYVIAVQRSTLVANNGKFATTISSGSGLDIAVPYGVATYATVTTERHYDSWTPVTLVGQSAPVITTQPKATKVASGGEATLSVAATGGLGLSYQWQRQVGGEWQDVTDATGATYTIAAAATSDTGRYRVLVTNIKGEVASDAVKIAVTGDVLSVDDVQLEWAYNRYAQYGVFGPWTQKATGKNVSTTTRNGEVVSGNSADANTDFTLVRFDGGTGSIDAATGAGTISWDTGTWVLNAYAGQYNAPDETLSDPRLTIAEDGSGTLSFEAYIPEHLDINGNPGGTVGPDRVVVAKFASVDIENGVITAVPEFAGIEYDTDETLSPWVACGTAGGSWPASWIDWLPASVKAHYYTTSCSSLNAMKAPLPVTATFEERPLELSTQPSDVSIDGGAKATFRVTAAGNPIEYQWQRLAAGDGQIWTDVEGATDAVYSFTTLAADNGARYRVVVGAGDAAITSAEALLTLRLEAPAITGQPVSIAVIEGQPARPQNTLGARFRTLASGVPAPSVQYEISRDGGSTWTETGDAIGQYDWFFVDAPGVDLDGALYRSVVSNGVGEPLISSAATLTVAARGEGPQTVAPSVAVVLPNNATQRTVFRTAGFDIAEDVTDGVTFALIEAEDYVAGQQPDPADILRSATFDADSIRTLDGWLEANLSINKAMGPNADQTLDAATAYVVVTYSTEAGNRAFDTVTVLPVAGQSAPEVTYEASEVSVDWNDETTLVAEVVANPAADLQWQSSDTGTGGWSDITGETTTSLELSEVKTGGFFRLVADNRVGRTVGEAIAVTVVPLTFTISAAPSVFGVPKVGRDLVANPGTVSPSFTTATVSYQWLRAGRSISGATQQRYTLTPTDSLKTVSVRVTIEREGYTTLVSTSAGRDVAKATFLAPRPTIKGVLKVGKTLSFSSGTWTPKASKYSYRWLADGKPISGAVGTKLTLTKALSGKRITVSVTGSKTGWQTLARVSTSTSKVSAR